MKPLRRDIVDLLVANAAASYAAIAAEALTRWFPANDAPAHALFFSIFAPIFMPVGLIIFAIVDFPAYSSLHALQSLVCYAVVFPMTYLILRGRKVPNFAFAPGVLAIVVSFFSWFMSWQQPALAQRQSDLEGKAVLPFSLTAVDGKTYSPANAKGNVVLLDFWGIGCPPCRLELSESTTPLAADKELAKRGLLVWSINVQDDPGVVRQFAEDKSFPFPVLLDLDSNVARKYEVEGIPQTVLIGRDGVIRRVWVGYGSSLDEEIRQAIERALDQTS